MQKILIPTDFSPVADNALNYGIEIASQFESELLLYHAYTFHRKVDFNMDFPEDEQPFVKKIERQMEFKKQQFIEKIQQKGLSVQTKIAEANVAYLFGREVTKNNISLIIMGSKGATGLTKVIFGSVAATALEISKVPVLVVPPKHSFVLPKQIVLACDLGEVSSSILAPLRALASQFNAKVTILNVNTDTNKTAPQVNDFNLDGVETTFREVPMSESINESINNFVEQNEFDLICMIRREKGFFENLFKKSITKTQVYDIKIPLLVLPEH